MNSDRDKMNLDELIGQAIDTSRPQFDAEAWQAKYGDQLARLGTDSQPAIIIRIFRSRIAQLTAAAVLIVAAGLLVVQQGPAEPENRHHIAAEPAQMTTAQSLRQAFREGGLDGLSEQCDRAARVLGPTSKGVSLADVL